ncbi:MAG: hypothetical protein HFJ45_03210 [Clostridia bacterium]|nr:hypothetical protein [Clostridia bacterium]
MKRKRAINFRTALVIFCCILIIQIEIGKTYSKYFRISEMHSISGIAKPYFLVNVNEIFNIEVLNLKVFEYEFSVQNYEEQSISEVSFFYNISFELSQKDAPIKIKLYRINNNLEEEIKLLNNSIIEPEHFKMSEEKNDYKVNVYYDINSNEIMEPNLKIDLKIEAVQEEVNI